MERMTAVINEGENPAAGKETGGGRGRGGGNTTTAKREGEEIEKADKATKKERKMKWRKINHRGNN